MSAFDEHDELGDLAGPEGRTGLEHARRRRRRRASVILWLVGLLVVGSFGYAVAYVAGIAPGSRRTPACTAPSTPPPPQSRSRVNVYNSTGRSGVANQLAEALRSRGFQVAIVGNDPYRKKLTGAGEIRFGPSGRAFAVQFLQPLAPGVVLAEDGRDDTSVDVILGGAFPQVPVAAPTPTPTPTC